MRMSETRGRFRIFPLLQRLFAIDLRALGVFRILLGIILVVDYLGRLPDLDAHYTEAGIMPVRAAQVYQNADIWLLVSPYFWNGSREWALTLMLISMAAALLLLIGWKTRFATFLIWFLVTALHTRYPLVQEGSDVYLRQMLFWSLFLPLGARFSVDGLAAQHVAHQRPLPRAVLSMASASLLLQVGIVYWFNAIAKSGPHWRTDFTALYFALSLEAFTTPIGIWFRDHLPWMLKPLTIGTILLEAFGPFLAFVPIATERIRPYIAVVFIFFHLFGIGLLMDVGAFHYVAALPWILFLPGSFWDRFGTVWSRLPEKLTEKPFALKDRFVDWRSARIARSIRAGATPPRLTLNPLGHLVAFFFFCFILVWNLRNTGEVWPVKILPQPSMEVVWLTRVDQYWGMFAPYPMAADAWTVIPAQTADGTLFDLYRMSTPVNYEKPRSVHEFYKNTRWRKYLTNLLEPRYQNQFPFYCQWLAREWNRTHQGPQTLYRLWYCVVEEPTLTDSRQPTQKLRVLHTYYNGAVPQIKPDFPPEVPEKFMPAPPPKQGVATNGADRSKKP